MTQHIGEVSYLFHLHILGLIHKYKQQIQNSIELSINVPFLEKCFKHYIMQIIYKYLYTAAVQVLVNDFCTVYRY